MIAAYVFARDLLPIAQRLFSFWRGKPVTVFLSDILFIEAGALILFGALIAGTTLYNSWAALDVRQVQFTEYIWNWRQMKKERDSTEGLMVGLAMLAAGSIYVVAAIIVSGAGVP